MDVVSGVSFAPFKVSIADVAMATKLSANHIELLRLCAVRGNIGFASGQI